MRDTPHVSADAGCRTNSGPVALHRFSITLPLPASFAPALVGRLRQPQASNQLIPHCLAHPALKGGHHALIRSALQQKFLQRRCKHEPETHCSTRRSIAAGGRRHGSFAGHSAELVHGPGYRAATGAIGCAGDKHRTDHGSVVIWRNTNVNRPQRRSHRRDALRRGLVV